MRTACGTGEYFHLEARPHLEEYEETARTLQDLLTEAVACRLDDGGPLCAFLEESPGSELAAAIAAKELGRRGRQLCAYSFELEGSEPPASCARLGKLGGKPHGGS